MEYRLNAQWRDYDRTIARLEAAGHGFWPGRQYWAFFEAPLQGDRGWRLHACCASHVRLIYQQLRLLSAWRNLQLQLLYLLLLVACVIWLIWAAFQ